MKCARCDKEFTAKRKSRKFCSDACRQRTHRPSRIEKYNRLVKDYNELAASYRLLFAARGLDKAIVDEAAKKLTG